MSRPEIIMETPEMRSEEKPENFLPRLSVIQIVNKSAGSSCRNKIFSNKCGGPQQSPYQRGRDSIAGVNVVVQID